MTIGYYGGDGYGTSPYGSRPPDIGVQSAAAIDGTHVEVTFNAVADFTFAPFLLPLNYTISPTLTVVSVEEVASDAVVLTTSPQTNVLYTVVVGAARNIVGAPLDPLHNSAQFTGFPMVPGYFAVATTDRRVRLVFSQIMLNDSNLSNPANYSITDFNGNVLPIVSATPEQPSNPVSVILTLGSNLGESDFYVSTVSSSVHTALGLNVQPPTSVFQWLLGDLQINTPLRLFSGEVSGPPLGDPDGLVFFSPALNVSTANSIIQIEEIDVCTTAYDTYTMPAPIDPPVLFTYGGGLVPTPSPDPYLLNQCVLWAPFPRNFEAQLEVAYSPEDEVPVPVDTSCSILLKQQYALGYVSLLNDPAWFLFDDKHGTSVPPTFITAKNLSKAVPKLIVGGSSVSALAKVHASAAAVLHGQGSVAAYVQKEVDAFAQPSSNLTATAKVAHQAHASLRGTASVIPYGQVYIGQNGIPSGPESIIVLHVQLGGTSNFAPATATKTGHMQLEGGVLAGTSQLFAGAGPPPVVLAQATLAAGASMRAFAGGVFAGVTVIHGVATLNALPSGDLNPPTVIFATSFLSGHGTIRATVAAHAAAGSGFSAAAHVRRGAHATLSGAAGITGTMVAHWAAHTALVGAATVIPVARVTHKAEAFPVGSATVTATAGFRRDAEASLAGSAAVRAVPT